MGPLTLIDHLEGVPLTCHANKKSEGHNQVVPACSEVLANCYFYGHLNIHQNHPMAWCSDALVKGITILQEVQADFIYNLRNKPNYSKLSVKLTNFELALMFFFRNINKGHGIKNRELPMQCPHQD